MTVQYTFIIFSILLCIITGNLIKSNKKFYYNKIDNLRLISTFSLIFGCINFFISFFVECYYQLQEIYSLNQVLLSEKAIIMNSLKVGVISPLLGIIYFFFGSFCANKLEQTKRLKFIKEKNYVTMR